MAKIFYSTAEVSKFFGVNRVTVYRWAREGKIHAFEIGKHLKIPAAEVDRLFKEFGFTRRERSDICGFKEIDEAIPTECRKELVVVISRDPEVLAVIDQALGSNSLCNRWRCSAYEDPLKAAIQIGKEKPALVIIDSGGSYSSKTLAMEISAIFNDVTILLVDDGTATNDETEDRFRRLERPLEGRSINRILAARGSPSCGETGGCQGEEDEG
ncbi:MAG: helix-turn-helix domain-containing protein [Deltaproteobacteria bacterium]|nr:helix-turn-helix domain-containing protein [Deltaproteobacteria bacterium]